MIGAVVLTWLLPIRTAGYAVGLSAGGLMILIAELSLAMGGVSQVRGRRESSLLRAGALVLLVATSLALVLGRPAKGQQPAGPDAGAGARILALFPYEGQDPTLPAKNVILRLADFNRLMRMAEPKIAAPLQSVRAVSAVHQLGRKTGRRVVVVSELAIVASGEGPFTWHVPVSGAREIAATLDGSDAPLSIAVGGELGEIMIPRGGSHLLSIRRLFATRTEAGFESLSFPVNALSSARVIVESPAEGQQAPVLASIGATQPQADGSQVGLLGPADRIELRWHDTGAPAHKPAPVTVDGLVLWDINPAGDRVRSRLSYQSAGELPPLRISHPGGLILRSARVLEQTGFVRSENSGKDEWTLHVEPPVQTAVTIELDCWMPFEPRASTGPPAARVREPAVALRQLSGLQPIGVERYSGMLGVRRPGDWTGRLDPILGSEPISDESFVKSWGTLPDEPLTLCGTKRFTRECGASLLTGPTPLRVTVKPTVGLQLEPGRVLISVDAELSEPSGRFGEVVAKLPENSQIIRKFAADGLA